MKRDQVFYKYLFLFWLASGLLMFLNGLRYGHWEVAAIRNIYLAIMGGILSLPISMSVDSYIRFKSSKRLFLTGVMIVAASVMIGLLLNPLTLSLLGASPHNFTLSSMTNQMVVFFILLCLWSWLYYHQAIKKQISKNPVELTKTTSYLFEIIDRGQLIKLSSDAILAITANGDYVHLHTENQQMMTSGRIKNIAELLKPFGFHRIHRSTLVNESHVQAVKKLGKGKYRVKLLHGLEFESSKSWETEVQKLIPLKA